MGRTIWKKQWKRWVKQTRYPGIWKMKEGGHIARARITDPTTGKLMELKKILPESRADEAFAWLEAQRQKVRAGVKLAQPQKMRFADFALCVFERKVKKQDLKSVSTQNKWKDILVHLIGGTSDAAGELAVAGFGELYVECIQAAHIERWKEGMGELIAAGTYAPGTVNGWLAVMKVIMKAAVREFDLPKLVTEGINKFDTSSHVTYSEEAPNSLTPEQVGPFLATLKEGFPQYYAMAYLGLATGLRPSSLRPLRHKGEEVDVLFDTGKLRVRRSQTGGAHSKVLNTTKQKTRYTIDLPPAACAVLRWHVETQFTTPEQEDSDLLFPSINGTFRASSVLNKPFAEVSDAIGLGYNFTQRGMRRTFNDLMRAAQVEAIVTRSISGHLTETMQNHYSTVSGAEQRTSIAKVINLMTTKEASDAA